MTEDRLLGYSATLGIWVLKTPAHGFEFQPGTPDGPLSLAGLIQGAGWVPVPPKLLGVAARILQPTELIR